MFQSITLTLVLLPWDAHTMKEFPLEMCESVHSLIATSLEQVQENCEKEHICPLPGN